MIEWSPLVAVSQDGRTVAVAVGAELLLVDTESGATELSSMRDAASVLALAPTRRRAAVTAAGWNLERLPDNGPAASLSAPIMLARVTDSGLVAALTRSDTAGTHLVILDAGGLEEIATLHLGNVSAWGLELDDASATAMLWGCSGDRPWEGVGEPYVHQVTWRDREIGIRWSTTSPEPEVDRIRTGGGNVVAVRGERLFASDLDSLAADGFAGATAVRAPNPIELLAISPVGRSIAFTTNDDAHSQLYSASFGGEFVDRGAVPDLLDAEEIAVDDDGRVVICGSGDSGTVDIAVAPPGSPLEERHHIEAPESGIFEDVEPE